MKRLIFLLTLLSLISSLFCQILEDLSTEPDSSKNQVVEVKYKKKNARLAMAASAIFPGAGQIYVSPKNYYAYIFPVVEIGLWYLYNHNYSKGDDITSDYKKFANTNYSRERQNTAQASLKVIDPDDIYNDGLFRLDAENTQHFYEDIGKYNKYIFGWNDWYNTYVNQQTGEIHWVINGTGANAVWLGNRPIDNPSMDSYDVPNCPNRTKYIKMRQDAEKYYSRGRDMNYLIMLNHMVSSIDAIRVTKKYNKGYLAVNKIDGGIQTAMYNNHLTPVLNLGIKF